MMQRERNNSAKIVIQSVFGFSNLLLIASASYICLQYKSDFSMGVLTSFGTLVGAALGTYICSILFSQKDYSLNQEIYCTSFVLAFISPILMHHFTNHEPLIKFVLPGVGNQIPKEFTITIESFFSFYLFSKFAIEIEKRLDDQCDFVSLIKKASTFALLCSTSYYFISAFFSLITNATERFLPNDTLSSVALMSQEGFDKVYAVICSIIIHDMFVIRNHRTGITDLIEQYNRAIDAEDTYTAVVHARR